jgi:hypothetical protein
MMRVPQRNACAGATADNNNAVATTARTVLRVIVARTSLSAASLASCR